MAVTAASIKTFAPVFASVADAIIEQWIVYAAGAVAAAVFGAAHDEAVTLWVCHQLARTGGDGSDGNTAGPVRGRHVGDVGIQFGERVFREQADPASYATTAYGQALMQLIRRYTRGPVCV